MTDDAIREAVASAIEERIRSGAASPWITTLSQELASVATFAYETAQAKTAPPLSPADLVNALMATARANPHDANCIAMLDAVSDPMPPLGDSRRKAAAPADSAPSVEAREAAMAWYRALTERDDYVNYVHNLALRLDEFAARKVAEAQRSQMERRKPTFVALALAEEAARMSPRALAIAIDDLVAEAGAQERERCALIAFSQTSDDPAPGDWNDACDHIADAIRNYT